MGGGSLNLTDTTIYYFTGTGNSLMIARAIASELGSAEAVSIARAVDGAPRVGSKCVGLVFPVYYGGLPHIVRQFISNLSGLKDTYFFAVATHAGEPGSVLPQLGQELQQTGHELSAGYLITMPSNYVVGYDAPGEHKIQAYLRAADGMIAEAVRAVTKKSIHKPSSTFPRYCGLSRMYQRFITDVNASDKSFWVTDDCTECGVCADVCPVKNIHMKGGRPDWLHRCEQCLACINWCPAKAIQYGKSTVERGRYTNPRVSIADIRS